MGTAAKCAGDHLYAQQRGYAPPLSTRLKAFDCSADIARILRMWAAVFSAEVAALSSKKAVQQ